MSFVLYPTRSRSPSFFHSSATIPPFTKALCFCVKNLLRFYRAFYMNNLYLIYNGNRTEWSSIGSVIIRVIDKIVLVRFVRV